MIVRWLFTFILCLGLWGRIQCWAEKRLTARYLRLTIREMPTLPKKNAQLKPWPALLKEMETWSKQYAVEICEYAYTPTSIEIRLAGDYCSLKAFIEQLAYTPTNPPYPFARLAFHQQGTYIELRLTLSHVSEPSECLPT